MSKIIVTGGCGFIGGHIVDKLIELGHQVIVIDDLSSTETEKFHFNDLATYHKKDICNKEEIENLFENVDYVFHMAAESRIQPAILNPTRAYSVNCLGTLNILELSKKWKIKRVMFSSTSSIYGMTETLPTREDSELDCLNPYAHSKYLGEELFKNYSKNYGVDSAIFRYFNVFGERSPKKGQYAPVTSIFLNQLNSGKNLTVVGDGSQKRDFVYVGDIVKANILAMNFEQKISAEIINVGSGRNMSIIELAKMISDNIEFIPERSGESKITLADITKLKTILEFEPITDIKDWLNKEICQNKK
jgi:UDP-glucose 4-epimerase